MVDVKSDNRGVRKERKGVVVSKSGDKSIVVLVETRKPHEVYRKVMTHTKKLYVHDEKNEAAVGDKVLVVETRPMSRMKRWRLVEVLEKAARKDLQGIE
ncbi:MAG: 30S ribosomal protein S17 [Kiritimatiellae bacterium]|nr:30S ribosomal protein S17 [Kiritimatiellia bacterium]MDD5522237.1 30S ribosomal protein S17 [Kiritimatiellia bacterium]